MSQEKILIITYAFPPTATVGVHRWLSLSKFLARAGSATYVLAPRNGVAPMYDLALLKQVSADVTVYRAFTPELPYRFRMAAWKALGGGGGNRRAAASSPQSTGGTSSPSSGSRSWFSRSIDRVTSPDPQVVWVPFALRQARRIIRKHRITTVIVSGPPYSPLLVGTSLKREFPTLKLVLDFRDEWLDYYLKQIDFAPRPDRLELCRTIEGAAVEAADLVMAVTDSQVDVLRSRYSHQPAGKFWRLANGYDPEIFGPSSKARNSTSRLTVTSTGTVLPLTSPDGYLAAVDALPPEMRDRLESRFIGRVTAESAAMVQASQSPLVKFYGFLPQQESFQHALDSDVLLVIQREASAQGGKLFEYLATGKPILALAPPHGEIGRLIQATGAGWCVHPDDAEGIRRTLLEVFRLMDHGPGKLDVNQNEVARYNRFHQAKALFEVLCSLQSGATGAAISASRPLRPVT